MGFLFPSLPDEIGWQCLLRIELSSHHKLRCVSKSWNAALKSPQFYQERKSLKISEQQICIFHRERQHNINRVTIYDPKNNSCKTLPPLPTEEEGSFRCHFYFVKEKLVLITDLVGSSERSCTWLYDFYCCKWQRGSSMPDRMNGFASAIDEQKGLIYVGGGFCYHRDHKYLLCSASVYNVEEDQWDFLPRMDTHPVSNQGVFADGKFYVMGDSHGGSFQVFDRDTKTWKMVEDTWNTWYRLLCTHGRLKGFSDGGFLEYDSKNRMRMTGALNWFTRGIIMSWLIGHNVIFLKSRWGCNEANKSFCSVEAPSERGGEIRWRRLERPSDLQGVIMHAVTLDL